MAAAKAGGSAARPGKADRAQASRPAPTASASARPREAPAASDGDRQRASKGAQRLAKETGVEGGWRDMAGGGGEPVFDHIQRPCDHGL